MISLDGWLWKIKKNMTSLELQERQGKTQSTDKNTKILREYRCHDIY